MKKFIFALLVTVMSLTVVAGFNVQAESTDGYTWLDDYETAGKKMMYPKKDRALFKTYGYSGVDVVLGNWVLPVTKGNVLVPGENMSIPGAGWGSFGQLYFNNTDQDWYIPITSEAAHATIFIDENGQVYQIYNSVFTFPFEGAQASTFYNVWWDETTNSVQYRGGASLVKKAHEDIQLTYGDLGVNYYWLTKATVDGATAEGVTFQATDLLYKDANGKYTNVATGNTAVMNDMKGYKIKPGEAMFAVEYLDNSNYNNADYIQQFYTLVNGQDNVAQINEHDITGPVISGTKTGTVELAIGSSIDLTTGVEAKDAGKLTVLGDETTTTVTHEIYKYNKTTAKYDILVTTMDESIGNKYKVIYSTQDALGNKSSKSFEIKIVAAYSPVFSGVQNLIFNMGAPIDLLNGITADDGYGNNITSNIVVYKGGLNTTSPKPGTYEVLYLVTNSLNATSSKTAIVTVMDTEKPNVIAPTGTIKIVQGTEFDLLSVVHGFDNYSTVKKTVVQDNWFDVYRLGEYDIEIHVADEAGNKTKVFFTVEVVEAGTDELSRIDDLESGLEDATKDLDDLGSELNSEINKNVNDLKTKNSNLETQISELQTKLEDNAQQSMIFTIIVAVIAVAGLGLTFVTKKS